MIDIIGKKNYPLLASGLLFVASVVALLVFGLKPGIDFTAGSLLELSWITGSRPTAAEIQAKLVPLNLGEVIVQPTGDKNILLRLRVVTEAQHEQILSLFQEEKKSAVVQPQPFTITANGGKSTITAVPVDASTSTASITAPVGTKTVVEERFETVGPSISASLKSRAFGTSLAVIAAIIIYIAYAFRKVSRPVQSWKYGVAAVLALFHDVTITMGVFALLGHFGGVEVNIPFVVAMLTVFSYSVNDTIVVFDRIREKLIRRGVGNFPETVNVAVNETIMRSINTSSASLLVLIALFFYGGETIHYFVLALIVGIALGTYSSVFVASPILVIWEKWKRERK